MQDELSKLFRSNTDQLRRISDAKGDAVISTPYGLCHVLKNAFHHIIVNYRYHKIEKELTFSTYLKHLQKSSKSIQTCFGFCSTCSSGASSSVCSPSTASPSGPASGSDPCSPSPPPPGTFSRLMDSCCWRLFLDSATEIVSTGISI